MKQSTNFKSCIQSDPFTRTFISELRCKGNINSSFLQ